MITLKSDNRQLLTNAKYSYLNDNYDAGVSSIVVTNSSGYAANDYLLLGNFGSETTEIVQINTGGVNTTTHTLTLTANTKFAHSESTKISILKYNQVKYYRTTTATFSASSPLGTVNLQADDYTTKYYDTTNSTGYGWFCFYNGTTAIASQNSNAIPYAGFAQNSVKSILDSFFSLLNAKDLKIITNVDAFSWLNEAYAITINELNIVNREHNVDDGYDLILASGQTEYGLPDDCDDVMAVYNADSTEEVGQIDLGLVDSWASDSNNDLKYYIRGDYIGFTPTPSSAVNLDVRYRKKAAELTSYYDNVELPNNTFHILKDFMMFRAAEKLNKTNPSTYLELFNANIQRLKVTSHTRGGGLDSWDSLPETLV